MAGVTCVHCGSALPNADAMLCPRCGGDQAFAPAPAALRAESTPSRGAGDRYRPEQQHLSSPAGQAPADVQATCPECGKLVPASHQICTTCYVPLPPGGVPTPRPEAPGGVAWLVLPNGRRIRLTASLTLGRDPQVSPVAGDLDAFRNVSRKHALLVSQDGRLMVTDLNSTNGTYINNMRLNGPTPRVLRPGDRLRLASNCELGLLTDERGGR